MRLLTPLLFLCCLVPARSQMKLVYPLPPDNSFTIQKDIAYHRAAGTDLKFDLYLPADHARSASLPLAIFLNGIGSPELRGWGQYTGWARLVTTAGLAGIAFDTHEGGIAEDFDTLIDYLHTHAAALHIDPSTVVLYACSANVTAGLPIAMDKRRTYLKAAVIYYGAGEVPKFRLDLPVFYVRAGLDGAGLNHAIDALVTRAIAANAPLTLVNFGAGHHGFDLVDDNSVAREIIARTLDFMKSQLTPSLRQSLNAGAVEAAAGSAVYREDWPAAVSAYEGLAAARPEDSEVHRNFGNALIGAGQYRRAIAQYERALALGNHNVGWISYAAATASVKLGDVEGALKWVENLKEIDVMRRRLRSDPDFASLRENPRFKAVAEMN